MFFEILLTVAIATPQQACEARVREVLSPRRHADLCLEAVNSVRDYWRTGRQAIDAGFPLLLVPMVSLHNSGIDAKGLRRSVAMVGWLVSETGDHAIPGIWPEGTDLYNAAAPAPVTEVERGKQPSCEKYASHLAVTPARMRTEPPETWSVGIDNQWAPPEKKAIRREVLERPGSGEIVELHVSPYSKVRVTRTGRKIVRRELHTSRSVGFTGRIGGVAVSERDLTQSDVARLTAVAAPGVRQAQKR